MDFSGFLVYIRDFDADFLSDFEDFLGVADISIDYLGDMDESIVLESDIDKSSECNHIAHDAIEDISDSYGLDCELLGTEHRSTLSTWIATEGLVRLPDEVYGCRSDFRIEIL